ncbi:MAG TPA: ADOP family duplicated permease [Longimicrobiales bacterium]|nr:ADOP family duplicated permease [Longimicrobiales bacterium]
MSLRFHFGQAIRSLRKSPGYALAFALTLGLAIGVNSAVFSVVNGVLLRPLPFQDAERLLYLKQPIRATGAEHIRFSFMELDDLRSGTAAFDEVVEFGDWNFTVVGVDEPHRVVGGLVTSNYFGVLGMRPTLGRMLDASDDARGAEPVMVLTDQYWERTFGRDPGVLGRVLELGGAGAPVPTRIVGVLEPGLHYTGSRQPDFYVNYAANPHYESAAMRDARTHRMTDVFARLAPGVTLEAARAELEAVAARMHAEYPETYPPHMGYGIEAVRWQDELTRQGRATFLTMMGTVAVILLLATANVANLTLTRLIRKQNELATRGALGARGTDLRLHLTAENVLLALAGGALGLLLAVVSRDSLASYAARFTVRAQEVGVDWTVLGVTLGGGLLVAVALAWLPGLPVEPGLHGAASARTRTTDGRMRKNAQRALVVGQLALSFALLTGASLLVRSLIRLTSVDPGFETRSVVTLQSPSFGIGTGAGPADRPFFEQALAELSVAPGVRSAAIATWTPLAAADPLARIVRVEGEQDADERSYLSAFNDVTPGYFETLGMTLLAGRFIDESDREETEDVVVIDESLARAHFDGVEPVGRTISVSQDGRSWQGPWRVVGVVADAHEYGIGTEDVHTLYRPAAQTVYGPAVLVAADGDPAMVARTAREVLWSIQPDRAVDQVHTLEELRAEEVAPSRLNATLFGSFAALALAIAAVGVLGTLGFSVSQRVREFGVRMALGADRRAVLGIVMGEGAALLAVGLAMGAVAALSLGRFLSGLLFGVGTVDAPSLASAAGLLALAALAAALLPAVRATRVQPTDALKSE